MPRPYSQAWLALIDRPRSRSWSVPLGANEPLLPWITPPVPPSLAALFRERGRERSFAAGQVLYGALDPLSAMTVITAGVAGRVLGNLYAQPKKGMAISIPGRICGGNHNFFSGRPGNGRYFAISRVRALTLPSVVIRERMETDADLRREVEIQLECCVQSDRIGLCAIAVLSVVERIRLCLTSWALAYGELRREEGQEWVLCQATLPLTQLALIVTSSLIHVKRGIAELRETGLLETRGPQFWLRPSLIDGAWDWLRANEEAVSGMPRPRDWRRYLR